MFGVDWARRLMPAVALLALALPGSSARSALAPVTLTVTVAHGSGGSVEVTSPGLRTSCAGTCTYRLGPGSNVTLTPLPGGSWTFVGWSGACSGGGSCLLTVTADTAATASFDPMLQVTTAGPGRVTGRGIDCGPTCSATEAYGSTLSFSAQAASGATFAGWSGDCSGTGSCTLSFTAPHAVGAAFATGTTPPPGGTTVTVTRTGAAGTVTSSPLGIACGNVCTGSFPLGAAVTLLATPGVGSYFVGWSGGCVGRGSLCPATAGSTAPATAMFGPIAAGPSFARVQVTVSGAGSVVSDPDGIDCGQVCDSGFATAGSVSLQAEPAPGSFFAGWGGRCSHTGPCTIVPGQASAVAASFRRAATVTAARRGPGQVTLTLLGGGACIAPCSQTVAVGRAAVLVAAPAPGARFKGWTGACVGASPRCEVTLDGDATVTAAFSSRPAARPMLVVTRTIGGSVTSSPPGINCGAVCSGDRAGTPVRLSENPDKGFVFAGWRGACKGRNPSCQPAAGSAAVTAVFRRSYIFSLTTVGDGSVDVSAPLPRALQHAALLRLIPLVSSQTATLTATAASDSYFVGWSGSCSGTAPTCTVAGDATKETTATFAPGVSTTVAYALDVTRVGDGMVRSNPAGIACGDLDHCQKAWAANQKVKLTAYPTPDTTFRGWGGACAGTDTCTVEVPVPEAVTARFVQTGSRCATSPALDASVTIRLRSRPRRLQVVLQPAVASTARLRVGRPGLSFIDYTATLAAGRNVVTLRVPSTVKAAVYLLTIVLNDSCGRTSTLQPRRVVVPRAGP